MPILVIQFEKPHTKAEREMSMMIKLTAFMVLNTVINGLLFTLPIFDTLLNPHPNYYFSPGWYVTGGQVLLMSILGDLVVVNLGLELVRPGDLIRRFHARRAKTQQQMNELFEGPEFVLEERYPVFLNTLFVTLFYCGGIPILLPFAMLMVFFSYFVDKYMLMRVYKMPMFDHSLAVMTAKLLPVAMTLHLCISCWM